MRKAICLSVLFLCFVVGFFAQQVRFPIEKKEGHLISEWVVGDSIKARVFLETGFPIIVFSQSFIEKHQKELGIKLETPTEDMYVRFWSGNQRYKVIYKLADSIVINGERIKIDAVVINSDEIEAWKGRDVIFPLYDLQRRIEINIAGGYMRILNPLERIPDEYISYDVNEDPDTKALYLTTYLKAFDKEGTGEELAGNFQLDLGAANAIVLNKNVSEVTDFVVRVDRMVMKDMTHVKGPKEMELSIIMPEKIQLDNIELSGDFIVAMMYLSSRRSDKYSGNIGNAFFARFSIIFDFENKKFYLKPLSDKVIVLE